MTALLARGVAAFAFACLLLSVPAGPSRAAEVMQRMVLAPGCYVVAAGSFYDASAYCLDQSREAPPSGAILSNTATSLDQAVVKIAAGGAVPFQQALAQHLVRIEGLGNRSQLRIRNLSDQTLEICVTGPTVVMGNGETRSSDLQKVSGEITRLLKSDNNAARDGDGNFQAHLAVQQKIWDAVNAADTEEAKEKSKDAGYVPSLPLKPEKPPLPDANQSKCAGTTDSAKVCLE